VLLIAEKDCHSKKSTTTTKVLTDDYQMGKEKKIVLFCLVRRNENKEFT
jgi:hypothetical protein